MSVKLSQINSGGTVAPTTDQLVAVRGGNTDVLVTPGQAAAKAVSNNSNPTVASVASTSIVAGHVASFADTTGTVQDGGVLGTAAAQAASSITGTVAAVTGSTTIGHLATFSDTTGTVQDGGAPPAGYVLPIATTSVLGGIKPDGTTITVNGSTGVASVSGSGPAYVAGSGTATAGGTGAFAAGGGASASAQDSVAIGNNATASGSQNSIAIGNGAVAANVDCTAIGNSTNVQGILCTAVGVGCTSGGGITGTTLYGYGATAANTGDIIIASSTQSFEVNGSTGQFKIPTDGNNLLATSAAVGNGAGSGAGTLTNAPAAGNPSIYIPININGTTYYIPAWT